MWETSKWQESEYKPYQLDRKSSRPQTIGSKLSPMIKGMSFFILAAALLGIKSAVAQGYLVGTKSASQHMHSQMDPRSGYCPDGTHLTRYNARVCGKAKVRVGNGKPNNR